MPSIVWKGYVSFGLVSFPVRLYSAGRAETIHFHMLHRKDLSRLKEVWYCAAEDKPIERAEIVKGYEVSKGRYIVVEDAELKSVAPPTASTMDIMQFVKNEDVDPIYFEHSYYVAADEKLTKPYSLFFDALKETKQCALAKLAMHGRENVVLIRTSADGPVLHTLFYPNELHKANRQAAPKSSATKKELELARSLIEQMSGSFEPKDLHDVYSENIEKLIAQKKKGAKVTSIEQPKRPAGIDLMEALKKSLQASAKSSLTKASKKPQRPRKAA